MLVSSGGFWWILLASGGFWYFMVVSAEHGGMTNITLTECDYEGRPKALKLPS